MGFISAGDSYIQRWDRALKGVNGIRKIVEDVLIVSERYYRHKSGVLEFLKRCKDHNIT